LFRPQLFYCPVPTPAFLHMTPERFNAKLNNERLKGWPETATNRRYIGEHITESIVTLFANKNVTSNQKYCKTCLLKLLFKNAQNAMLQPFAKSFLRAEKLLTCIC